MLGTMHQGIRSDSVWFTVTNNERVQAKIQIYYLIASTVARMNIVYFIWMVVKLYA